MCSLGIDTLEISISQDVYTNYTDAKQFQIRLYATQPDGTEGVSYMTLLANDAPLIGSCTIDSTEGLAMKTVFKIECSGWSDDDGIDMYELFSKLFLLIFSNVSTCISTRVFRH